MENSAERAEIGIGKRMKNADHPVTAPEVYAYFDYRELLKDLYGHRKGLNPNFSYRYIGQRAGFKSAGYFTRMLQGKSSLSVHMALRLAEVFRLKKHEAEFLELLVLFSRAKTQSEKARYFEKLLSMRKAKVKTLDGRQYELFRHWYNIAVREILNFHIFRDDYAELARMVIPPITPAEAQSAISTLESLGFIRRNLEGYYEQVDSVLTTGDGWKSLAIIRFQQECLDLAKRSFDLVRKEHRDISTLTIAISSEEFGWIKEKIAGLQREILEHVRNAARTDRAYQVNFQVFPLSRIENAGAGMERKT